MLCIGRVYCDIIFTDLPRLPTPGTEVFSGGLGIHAGGGAAITAGHLSCLGRMTSLAGYLPGSGFGQAVRRELTAIGVDLSLCCDQSSQSDPQLTVALVQGDERAFVTRRTGQAFPAIDMQRLKKMAPKHIHVGEATTLIENPNLIPLAKDLGASLSLDCSWDDALDGAQLLQLLPDVDIFFPNASELELLRTLGLPDRVSSLTVVKQGRLGATALTGTVEIHAPALDVDVVDTTGAGDAFNAAFLDRWLEDCPIEDCLERGNQMGAEAVTYRGGLSGKHGNTSPDGALALSRNV